MVMPWWWMVQGDWNAAACASPFSWGAREQLQKQLLRRQKGRASTMKKWKVMSRHPPKALYFQPQEVLLEGARLCLGQRHPQPNHHPLPPLYFQRHRLFFVS